MIEEPERIFEVTQKQLEALVEFLKTGPELDHEAGDLVGITVHSRLGILRAYIGPGSVDFNQDGTRFEEEEDIVESLAEFIERAAKELGDEEEGEE